MRWRRGGTKNGADTDSLVGAALLALRSGDRRRALALLNDAAADSGDPGRKHDIALLLWRQLGEPRRAEALLRRAADEGSVPAMNALGVLLQQLNQAREAEQWLRIAADSGYPDALNNLGNLLERRGDVAEAVEFWRTAAESGQTTAMATLALVLFTHGRQEEAAQWCDRALLLTATQEHPDQEAVCKLTLARTLLDNGERMPERPFAGDEGVRDQPLRMAEPGDPLAVATTLHHTFLTNRDPGLLDPALHAARNAVELCEAESEAEPDRRRHAEALRILGSLLRSDYERKQEPALLDEAVEVGRAALKAAEGDSARGHARSSLGATLLIKHMTVHDATALDEAIAELEEARRLLGADDPEWPGITSTLGSALIQQHVRDAQDGGSLTLIEKGIGHLEAAIAATPAHDPELPGRQYNLAMAKVQLGAVTHDIGILSQAAALLQQAVQRMPEQHPARLRAVRMLAALGGSAGGAGEAQAGDPTSI